MSIYLFTNKKNYHYDLFIKALYKSFNFINYDSIIIRKGSEYKIDEGILIGDYSIKEMHKFLGGNDKLIKFIFNLPDNYKQDNMTIRMIDYDSEIAHKSNISKEHIDQLVIDKTNYQLLLKKYMVDNDRLTQREKNTPSLSKKVKRNKILRQEMNEEKDRLDVIDKKILSEEAKYSNIFRKYNSNFYVSPTGPYTLMIRWGSYLLPPEIEECNKTLIENFEMPKNIFYNYKIKGNNFISDFQKNTYYKIITNSRIKYDEIDGYACLFSNNNNKFLLNAFLTITSHGKICITNSTFLYEIFGDNILYVKDRKDLKDRFDNYDFTLDKCVNNINEIYDKYTLKSRCQELINFTNTKLI